MALYRGVALCDEHIEPAIRRASGPSVRSRHHRWWLSARWGLLLHPPGLLFIRTYMGLKLATSPEFSKNATGPLPGDRILHQPNDDHPG